MKETDKKGVPEDTSESEQETSDTGQQAKPTVPPRRGRTFGTTGAEKRG